ncbi:SPFH domain-containing protein [Streptomyces sp. NPDC054787]
MHTLPQPGVPHPQGQADDPAPASRRPRGEDLPGEPADAHRVPGLGGAAPGPAGRRTWGEGQADSPGPAARRTWGEGLQAEPTDAHRVPGLGGADPGPAGRRPRGEDLPADPGPAGRRTRGEGQADNPGPAARRTWGEGLPGEPPQAHRVPGLGGADPGRVGHRTGGGDLAGEPADAHRVPGPVGGELGPAARRTSGEGQADDPAPAVRRTPGGDLAGEPPHAHRVRGPGGADPGPAARRTRGEDLPADPGPAGHGTPGEGQADDSGTAVRRTPGGDLAGEPADAHRVPGPVGGEPGAVGRTAQGDDLAGEPADVHRVPGPGVAGIVAQAVSRGLAEGDVPELARLRPAPRGSAVTEVPVHLPFRGAQQPTQQPTQQPAPQPAPKHGPAPQPTAVTRPAPGRRVPRGDHRLREHRGPVLPGWVGVAVGGTALAGCAAVLWRAGAVPDPFLAAFGAAPRAYRGLRATHWPPLAFLGIVALIALGGLGRARAGHAWVLTLFGRYRGTVRRTGLTWVSPLLLRRRVDVRLRHWRSDPMPAVDSGGLALQVVVQVVWQVKDTARATLAVADHTEYLAEQVESAMARVLSQLPADAFHEDAPTLRDAEAVGDALTRMLAAETEAVGIEVFSAQPTRIEYAAEVAEAMRRRRVAAIDAKHRDTVLTSIVDAVDDTVHRLTSRGLVELDDYERKALVKDLTVAFYTGRCE